MRNIKKIFLTLTLVIILAIANYLVANSSISVREGKKILIVASYSVNDPWEDSIIRGFEENMKKDDTIKVEFLDSRLLATKEYDESFINLLNLKYKGNIDYIVALDDEAFQLVRNNLFNEELFTYKKPIVFAGVNDAISLTNKESEYITGIIERADNLLILNTILNAEQDIDEIYLFLDKSIYSSTLGTSIKNLVKLADKPCKINIIQGVYYNDIISEIEKINKKNSAILLCSTYKDDISNETILPGDLICNIKSITKVPIYTTLEPYIIEGAIGGIVNDGYKLGILLTSVLENIMAQNNIYNIVPPHDTFSIPIFNYKAVREYNVDPLKLPRDSIYINKEFYNLLLPTYMIAIIWVVILLCIVGVIFLVYLLCLNKKRAKHNNLLLVESIEREKIKTDFIVTISHELRTPLNIIINATSLLKIKLDTNNFEKEFFYEKLSYITKNSHRLRRYINNLIDVNRLEMGYMDTKFSNRNIVEVIEEVTMTIVDLASKHNIEVIFDTEEEEIVTAIDKEKIERVILNLLSNAIKFTKDGGSILVLVKRENDNVIIRVQDNGIGMEGEFKKHIFEKFKRAEVNEGLKRQYEGSGLGLFIVKGLIDLHKGSIEIESRVNEGTTFIITLPIVIVESNVSEDMISSASLEHMFAMEFSDIDKKQ